MLEIGAVSAALLGAAAYGTGDFIGSRAALRLSTFSAVAIAQTVAMVLMLQHFLMDGGAIPTGALFSSSVLAGLAYATGLMLLYHGFAYGRIGVVAPLCGLFSILVPLGGELLVGEGTTEWHLIGIALCCLAVVFIAGSTRDRNGRLGFSVRLGVMSGVGYGIADLCLGIMPAEVASGALLMTRSVAAMTATALLCWSLTRRSAIRAADAEGAGTPLAAILDAGRPRFALRLHHGVLLAVLAGVFDMLGHIGYVSAAVDGNMGVAAALVALFPAVSVVLAILFLNERISRNQAIGFACSIAGVFLLAD